MPNLLSMKQIRASWLILFSTILLAACGGSGSSHKNQSPLAQFTASTVSDTDSLTITFNANNSSDSDGSIRSYQWSFGDGNSGTSNVVNHTYSSAGSYTVTLTVTDNKNASTSTTQIIEIKTTLIPKITLSLTTDGAIQFDGRESSILGATNTQLTITQYDWDFGDDNVASGAVVTHKYIEPGAFIATLTITDSTGNSDSESIRTSFKASGKIFAASNTQVDVDINDPSRQSLVTSADAFVSNNSSLSAQNVNNPILLNGFVSAVGSSTIEVDNGNFSDHPDNYDYYYATLVKGQFISIRIADFDANDPSKNNIDLSLLDTDLNLVALSGAPDKEFESVIADHGGEYFIKIEAASGISKYILSIGGSSLINSHEAYGTSLDFIAGEAIVKLKELTNNRLKNSVSSRVNVQLPLSHHESSRPGLLRFNLTTAGAGTRTGTGISASNLNAQSINVTQNKLTTLDYIKALNKRADVEYAEPNYRVKTHLAPNDSYFPLQKHYAQINLPQAWEITTGRDNEDSVIVAIVDTGVVFEHEDLQGKTTSGYDFISNPETAQDGGGIDNDPSDPGDGGEATQSSWHGTHVAGTIAAASDNGIGVSGVSWGAKIMPLRVLGKGGGSSYDLEQSLRYAAGLANDSRTIPDQTADIINLSLGGTGYSQSAQNLYQQIHDAGIIVVAAAGNENSSTPDYPASYDYVVSVSAVDIDNKLTQYSNFGGSVDIAAPGGDLSIDRDADGYGDGILSTIIDDSDGTIVDGYSFLQGTSMAAPHIAGVAALMKSIYPILTASEFDSALQNGMLTNIDSETQRNDSVGYGIIDALKAVQHAEFLANGSATGSVISTASHLDFSSQINSRTITLRHSGTNIPTVVNIANSSSWLTIESSDIDEHGLGTYTISVDRSGLNDAVFSDSIKISLDNGSTIKISVSMQVKTTSSKISDAGYLYILLLDAGTFEFVAQVNLDIQDGEYHYQFDNIPYGEYYIIGGSDIDNNSYICGIGETCGSYPTNDLLQRVLIDSDVENLDFLASIVSGPISSSKFEQDKSGVTKLNKKEPLQRLFDHTSNSPSQTENKKLQ